MSTTPHPIIPTSVHPSWYDTLAQIPEQLDRVAGLIDATPVIAPTRDRVWAALFQPMDQVRVLILGQDPYPTPGHATGLAFDVDPAVKPLPRSLINIHTELHADLGVPAPATGSLKPWATEGVWLLNRVLTVEPRPGGAGSHQRRGWEEITSHLISAVAARPQPLVAILWGRHAQTATPLIGENRVIASAHPSPLSARRGFFGSRPFSRANDILAAQGGDRLTWHL